LPGVLRTRVGFAGGQKLNPTYRSLGDHTETIAVDYDSSVISYAELLDVFWHAHNPCRTSSRQYMSAIFYYEPKSLNEENQYEVIQRSLKNYVAESGASKVATVIEKAGPFYVAEDYHQKFMLRQHPKIIEFVGLKGEDKKLISSTIACKLNGFLGRNSTIQQFQTQLDTSFSSVPKEKRDALSTMVKQVRGR